MYVLLCVCVCVGGFMVQRMVEGLWVLGLLGFWVQDSGLAGLQLGV